MTVAEILQMGLWHKVVSQPLRYAVSYASIAMRGRTSSPPPSPHRRTSSRRLPRDELHALDIILNEQKPDHPSNVFFQQAMGHTRPFSTTTSDRGRRLPDRSGVNTTIQPRKSTYSLTIEGGSKRSRKPIGRLNKRCPSRKLSKSQKRKLEVASGNPPFQPKSARESKRKQPDSDVHYASGSCKKQSMLTPSRYVSGHNMVSLWKEERPGWKVLPPAKGTSEHSSLQSLRHRLWEKWVTRGPYRSPIGEQELMRYCIMFKSAGN